LRFFVFLDDGVEKEPDESAELSEAVHLVKEGDAVYHAPWSFFTFWHIVILPVIDEYKASTWWKEIVPCFIRLWGRTIRECLVLREGIFYHGN
jgi:hypothetical protein